MPRRKVKPATTTDPGWERIERLSRRQAQTSMVMGVVCALAGMVLAFCGILWAGLRSRRVTDPSTWPAAAQVLVAVGATTAFGGAAWTLGATAMRSRWKKDLRRMRDGR